MAHVSERVDLGPRVRASHATRRGQLVFLPTILAGAAGAIAMLVPPRLGLFIVAGVTIAWAVWVFVTRGERYLAPSGVFAVMVGVFLGAAALYLGLLGSEHVSDTELRDTAVITLITTMATDAVCIMRSIARGTTWPISPEGSSDDAARERRGATFRPPPHFELKGIVLILVSKLPVIQGLGASISTAIGLVGTIMVCLGLSSIRQRIRWAGDAAFALFAIAVPAWWVSTVFTGYGRLRLAGIAFGVLATWNLMRPMRLHKWLAVLALPGLLLYMGESRRELQNKELGRPTQEAGVGAGLGSVYTPLETFAWISTQHDFAGGPSVGPRYGGTFVNTVLLPVPRDWWPGKPKGFGAELTDLLLPQYTKYGNSMAALGPGEWYANFGWLGLPAMAVTLGWFLAWCDRWHARVVSTGFADARTWYSTVCLVCITSSLGELYWVGTFGFYDRGGLAAVIGGLVLVLSVRRNRSRDVPPEPGAVAPGRARPTRGPQLDLTSTGS